MIALLELLVLVLASTEVPDEIGAFGVKGAIDPVDTAGTDLGVGVGVGVDDEDEVEDLEVVDEVLDLEVVKEAFAVVEVDFGVVEVLPIPSNDVKSSKGSKGSNTWRFWNWRWRRARSTGRPWCASPMIKCRKRKECSVGVRRRWSRSQHSRIELRGK